MNTTKSHTKCLVNLPYKIVILKKINYILLICLLFSSELFSQEKKIIHINENFEEISEMEFTKNSSSPEYLELLFENDSAVHAMLQLRKHNGKLNENQLNDLKENLNIQNNIDNELIVVIYYPGKDWCNDKDSNSTWSIFHRDYLKELSKISKVSHHWIYKNEENLQFYYPKKVEWKKDSDQFIEKLFFKYHYPCFSFVVIDSKGNFIANYGEFGKQTVWEIAEELKKLK